jgi:tetratricopeptide (TPR) repeat protein
MKHNLLLFLAFLLSEGLLWRGGGFLLAQTPDSMTTNGLVELSKRTLGNRPLSLQYAKRAFDQSNGADVSTRAHAAYQYGYLLRLNGKFEEAETVQQEALKHSETAHDLEKSLRARLEMGRSQYSLRKLPEAMETYVVIEETYEKQIAPVHGERFSDIKAQTLERMGVLLTNQRKYEQAEKSLREAVTINKRRGDSAQIEVSQNGLGNVFIFTHQYAKALPIFQENLKIMEKLGRPQGLALNNLGICHKGLGQLDSANFYYRKALDSYQTNRQPLYYNQTLVNLAEIFNLKNQSDSALAYLNTALNLTMVYRRLIPKWWWQKHWQAITKRR